MYKAIINVSSLPIRCEWLADIHISYRDYKLKMLKIQQINIDYNFIFDIIILLINLVYLKK